MSSSPDAAPLIELFHHRWAVPLLAELGRSGGTGRFVMLVHRLGVAQESLRRTLAAALERGYVVRNPGHGHPLRPDYLLTPAGAALAPACAELLSVLDRLDLIDAGLRKWSMPVVHVLGRAERGFTELRGALPAVTPRALSLALGTLHEQGVVEREWQRYRLAPRAGPLPPPLRALALAGRAAA